jgi:hypothetical protein
MASLTGEPELLTYAPDKAARIYPDGEVRWFQRFEEATVPFTGPDGTGWVLVAQDDPKHNNYRFLFKDGKIVSATKRLTQVERFFFASVPMAAVAELPTLAVKGFTHSPWISLAVFNVIFFPLFFRYIRRIKWTHDLL